MTQNGPRSAYYNRNVVSSEKCLLQALYIISTNQDIVSGNAAVQKKKVLQLYLDRGRTSPYNIQYYLHGQVLIEVSGEIIQLFRLCYLYNVMFYRTFNTSLCSQCGVLIVQLKNI